MSKINFFPLFLPEIKEMITLRDYKSLRHFLTQVDPVDLAEGWQALSREEQSVIFRLLPRRLESQLFEELEVEEQQALLDGLRDSSVQSLLGNLQASETSQLIRELPEKVVHRFLGLLKKAQADSVTPSLQFSEKSVGSLMRTRFITIHKDWTTQEALERIRVNTRLRHVDEIYLETIYVADASERLVGQVPLKKIIVAPRGMKVDQMMEKRIHQLNPESDQEEASNLFKKYKLTSAPVVSQEGRMLGILLVRDIFKVIEQETEEDFAKMAGTQAGLLSRSIFFITKTRFPWLIVTCLGYFAVGWVVNHFRGTLAKVIGLTSFMPLIAAMGGNVGSQTATAVVRGLATGEIRSLSRREVILKEICVGFFLGLLYGSGTGLASHLIYGIQFGWRFSAVVGLGMFASIMAASIMGALEPFIFEKLEIDPATATGPLITFCADFVSTFTYLSVATFLFMF
ncbi:MAG: magnesium transporter [Chlamydiae bacterium]|nr:magnesium transporter [Chlamydiota bacterium]